jgi:YlqD protein
MDVSKSNLLLKRVVNVKVIVTPLWKDEVQQQLQTQINQLDQQLQQLDNSEAEFATTRPSDSPTN